MKPKLLIVDDEKNIRRMLVMILESSGYAVSEASSAEDAIAHLAEAPADVVLLDVRLPGMDGLEALKILRADHPSSGVIMISSYSWRWDSAATMSRLMSNRVDLAGCPFCTDRSIPFRMTRSPGATVPAASSSR